MTTVSAAQTYTYDNHGPQAADHHRALADLFDEVSQQITEHEVLNYRRGAFTGRCLDVAAGGGTYARWLADQLAPEGRVVATDLHPHHIPAHQRLQVLQHNLSDPLPDDEPFDFIHARLILNHLPTRRDILRRLVAALAPGGIILVEDLHPMSGDELVAYAPTPEDALLLGVFQLAHSQILREHGADPGWSLCAHGALIEEGLIDVHTSVYGTDWPGDSPGTRLLSATLAQTRLDLHTIAGLNETDLDRIQELLRDPRLVLHGHRLVSTLGRKSLPVGPVTVAA